MIFVKVGSAVPTAVYRQSKNTRAPRRCRFDGNCGCVASHSHGDASRRHQVVRGRPSSWSRLPQADCVLQSLDLGESFSTSLERSKHSSPALREPRGQMDRSKNILSVFFRALDEVSSENPAGFIERLTKSSCRSRGTGIRAQEK